MRQEIMAFGDGSIKALIAKALKTKDHKMGLVKKLTKVK